MLAMTMTRLFSVLPGFFAATTLIVSVFLSCEHRNATTEQSAAVEIKQPVGFDWLEFLPATANDRSALLQDNVHSEVKLAIQQKLIAHYASPQLQDLPSFSQKKDIPIGELLTLQCKDKRCQSPQLLWNEDILGNLYGPALETTQTNLRDRVATLPLSPSVALRCANTVPASLAIGVAKELATKTNALWIVGSTVVLPKGVRTRGTPVTGIATGVLANLSENKGFEVIAGDSCGNFFTRWEQSADTDAKNLSLQGASLLGSHVALQDGRISISDKIFFRVGSARIDRRSFDILQQVAAVLKANPNIGSLQIQGHTDNVGSATANLSLSARRAKSVRSFLRKSGVDKERLQSQGFGDSMPLASNDTKEGQAQNRRVEFIVESTPETTAP